MAKKKILILTGWLPGGGAERVLIDILRNIDYGLYDVDLALFEKKGELLSEVPPQVNIIEIWGRNSFNYFAAIKSTLHLHNNILLSKRINGSKLKKDYDAEIAFLEGMPVKLIALRKTEAPKYCWIHTDLSKFQGSKTSFYSNAEEQTSYSKMDKIVCVSENARLGFIACFPDLQNKTITIYNPVDKDSIISKSSLSDQKLKKTGAQINIVTVGRLHSEKNPDRLLQVAKLADKEGLDVKFHWLGSGPMLDEIVKKRDEAKLTEKIEFYGFNNNPFPYIRQSDIMLLPSDAEGFGLVLVESMCLGVPVISTPTAGAKEIIGNNEFGLLSDFSPESILEAVKRIINDKELKNQLIEAGRKRVEQFSVENAMKHFYRLID